MKKAIAITSTILGIILLAGCSQQPASQSQSATPVVAQQPTQPVVSKPANETTTQPASQSQSATPAVAQQPTQPVVSKPANETTTWQTYNSISGISFKYPKNWKCSAMTSVEGIYGANCGLSELEEKFVVVTTTFGKDTTFEQWLDNSKKVATKIYGNTTVGGKNSLEAIYTDKGGQVVYEILIDFNGKGLSLRFPDIQDKKDLGNIEQQILSSFKFTESH